VVVYFCGPEKEQQVIPKVLWGRYCLLVQGSSTSWSGQDNGICVRIWLVVLREIEKQNRTNKYELSEEIALDVGLKQSKLNKSM